MSSVQKRMIKQGSKPITTTTINKQTRPLPDEESDSDEDALDSSSSTSEESQDVTEEALQRMFNLLGEVDAQELGLLQSGDDEQEDDDDDDEDQDILMQSDDEDEQEQEEDEDEDDDDEQELYEDLSVEEDEDVVPVERTTVNDKTALERVLASFKTDSTFFDTLTLTNPKQLNIPDPENDLERELEFYKQALWAAQHAEALFDQAGLPFHRPDDYFAEMLKTDAHMSTIRQSLLDESAGIKASEEARKLRDAKKFGKKVQVERLKEREKEKKEVGKRLESLKKKRKGADGGFATTEDFDVALEDAISGNAAKKRKVVESERGARGGRGGGRGGRGGITRRGRDTKHGHPTTSRRPKENNDKIDGDGFSKRGGGGRGGGRGGSSRGGRGGSSRGGSARGGAKRLGKSRRN